MGAENLSLGDTGANKAESAASIQLITISFGGGGDHETPPCTSLVRPLCEPAPWDELAGQGPSQLHLRVCDDWSVWDVGFRSPQCFIQSVDAVKRLGNPGPKHHSM